jgi:peptidoglycan hydrolase CwlO-like protein
MFKKLLVALVLASVPVVVTGCGGSDKDAANGGDAAGDKSPLDELKAMNDDTQKQIDALLQPVTDVDDIVKQVDELPKKHAKVKSADLKKMLKTACDGGELDVTAVDADGKEDVVALGAKVKAVCTGIKATPEKVQALVAGMPAKLAQIPVLVGKAQASLTVKANSPFGNAEEKVKAKADLADLEKIKTDTMSKFEDAKKKLTDLPGKAKDASVKLSATLG